MGLHSQVSDCSSESLLILAVVTLATWINHLRSFTLSLLRSTGLLSRSNHQDDVHVELLGAVGSGLSNLILLAEQLNMNRDCSYRFDGEPGSKCVVCLSGLKEGDQVRRLGCCHVFHKDCFDGWLDHMNFTCPVCRSPVVCDRHVAVKERRVGMDLVKFFSLW